MARKTLKSALKAHEVRKAKALHAKKVEDSILRKQGSIQASLGNGTKKASKKAAVPVQSPLRPLTSKGAKGRQTRIQVFERDDTILLVGEGNFSFAHSLLLPPYSLNPSQILATAFDSEKECHQKYPDAAEHISALRQRAGRDDIVAFGVDAGDLIANKTVRARGAALHPSGSSFSWSKIVFNFPHVGAGHKDETRNIMSNQLLIIRFLVSASRLLTRGALPVYVPGQEKKESAEQDWEGDEEMSSDEDDQGGVQENVPSKLHAPNRCGSILITLRNCKPYTLWDVPTLAKRLSSVFQPIVQGAPALPKGQKAPSQAQISEVMDLGQGKSYRIWRSFAFRPSEWSGYAHRRTIGWREGVSKGDNEDILRNEETGECRTWQLGLAG
jgi:25S rRNA (uracil2634-N3)-methyltransferase